jgi:hypothetical protein
MFVDIEDRPYFESRIKRVPGSTRLFFQLSFSFNCTLDQHSWIVSGPLYAQIDKGIAHDVYKIAEIGRFGKLSLAVHLQSQTWLTRRLATA